MSQENVETARPILDGFTRRDWAEWESLHHPDVEWADPPPMDDALFQLFDFEDGRVRRVETFRLRAEALGAAGLPELS